MGYSFLVLSVTREDDALNSAELFGQWEIALHCPITQSQDDKDNRCLQDEANA